MTYPLVSAYNIVDEQQIGPPVLAAGQLLPLVDVTPQWAAGVLKVDATQEQHKGIGHSEAYVSKDVELHKEADVSGHAPRGGLTVCQGTRHGQPVYGEQQSANDKERDRDEGAGNKQSASSCMQ